MVLKRGKFSSHCKQCGVPIRLHMKGEVPICVICKFSKEKEQSKEAATNPFAPKSKNQFVLDKDTMKVKKR